MTIPTALTQALHSLDWPNILAGTAISSSIAFVIWIVRALWQRATADNDLPTEIVGKWYSAEYDVKKDIAHTKRNTFLAVKISKTFRGRIRIASKGHVEKAVKPLTTGWRVDGHIIGDCLAGEWVTTIRHSKRYGVVMIKFLDFGRAVGYWVGISGTDYPIYGYWIMCRDKSDLDVLAAEALKHFYVYDIGFVVSRFDQLGTGLVNVRI